MLRAVIFDFDGVITDSEILHWRTFNRVLAPYSITINQKDYYKNYLGLSDKDLFGLFIERGLIKSDTTNVDELIRQKNEIFEKLASSEDRIIEGVRSFLEMLSVNNIATAICSGALLSEIELILEGASLRDFFEVVISADQVRRGKPHPEGFLLTLEKLNQNRADAVTAEQCIVIEDSHWGLQAAKAAGMHTIAITNSYDAEQLAMAEKIVSHLNELSIDDLRRLCQ
ncbi:MAG: HAD family hydrolase [Planctomycetota bacterium]|jgi:beta-phosphoglucomutase